jgi:hypothetical protein
LDSVKGCAREFLQALHKACWRDGFGWCIFDKVGKAHARSLVDLSVQGAEWLMYEGLADLGPGLTQKSRPDEGSGIKGLVDAQAFLTTFNPGDAAALIAAARKEKEVEAAPIRKIALAALQTKITKHVKKTLGENIPADWAEKRAEAFVAGFLLPGIPVVFITKDGSRKTVDIEEVMNNWQKYDQLEMEHPHGYDHICTRFYANQGKDMLIHTFAHGEQIFFLRWDYPAIRRAIHLGKPREAAKTLGRMLLHSAGVVDAVEKGKLIQYASERSGVGKIMPIKNVIKAMEEKHKDEINKAEGKEGKDSAVDTLLRLAHQDTTFFHFEDRGYAAILNKEENIRATYSINGKGFQKWLRAAYFAETQHGAPAEGLKTCINSLEAEAIHQGKEEKVWLRVARFGEKIYLDLGNENWEAVEIDAKGWKIVPIPPVYFRRPHGQRPLVTPVEGGSIKRLLRFLNLQSSSAKEEKEGAKNGSDNKDLVLTVAHMLGTFYPEGPYCNLAVSGEQGSAKTWFSKILLWLTDPNITSTRALPKTERDLAIMAENAHNLAFDNTSGISLDMANAICRLNTESGFSVREHWEAREEEIFSLCRSTILNGIGDLISRSDLVDRSLFVTLAPIPERKRKYEKELLADFAQERGKILGALLDGVSTGLRRFNEIVVADKPRMADFARWVTACETAFWPEHI